MAPNYTDSERHNIASDIARWKVESEEVGSGNEFTADDLREYVEMLYSFSDEKLQTHWDTTVGEWVLSRNDMPPIGDSEHQSTQTWLSQVYADLVTGTTPPWGYTSWVTIPEPTEL